MNTDLLKWTLLGEGLLIGFILIQLIYFFWQNKSLEITLSFLSLLALFAVARIYGLDESVDILKIKDWILVGLFLLIALGPYFVFTFKKIVRPSHIRRFLTRGGPLDELLISCEVLHQEKVGALIAIERWNSLRSYVQKGVMIDSRVKRQLLVSLFAPNTPTHDGGVIISGDRIAACAVIFPLSQRQFSGLKLGTRHRAALGLSEHTDALIITISEETGKVSLACEGRLYFDVSISKLKKQIRKLIT